MSPMKKILFSAAAVCAAVAFVSCVKSVDVTGCTENAVAREYLETVSYPDGDYSESQIARFDTLKTGFRKDQPAPLVVRWENKPLADMALTVACDARMTEILSVTPVDAEADSALVFNLVPGRKYWYKVSGQDAKQKEKVLVKGALVAEGPLRMIRTDALHNVRDLGGWKTADGKTLKYGKIFRGGQMNRQPLPTESDLDVLKRQLGIKADVDLRWDSELDNGTPDDPSDDLVYTPLGEGVEYTHMPVNLYALWESDTTQWNNMISFMMDHVIADEPVYVHCAAGADRTGTTCFLLEGVLGVPEESLAKEYELTSFSTYGRRNRDNEVAYKPMIQYLLKRDGETLRDKFENYLTEYVGIPGEKIEAFRAAMLED